jgi:ABC-type branched-subunit amino acid transport system permease subunit
VIFIGRFATGVLAGSAVLLLVLALFVGWYSLTYTQQDALVANYWAETFFPGQAVSGQVATLGGPFPGHFSKNVSDYAEQGLTRTGQLYEAVQLLVLSAIIVGAVGGFLALAPRAPSMRRKGVATSLLLACAVLALVAPIALVDLQPSALRQDPTGFNVPWNSPGASFFGSCTYGQCGRNFGSWGPSWGWYLSVAAAALMVIAALVFLWTTRRGRRGPQEDPPRGRS